MATIFTGSLSTPIRASSGFQSRRPDPASKRHSSSANCRSPLFGRSYDSDYINNTNEGKKPESPDVDSSRVRSRFAPGCFTEDKAKQLRRKTMEGINFHDVMYHSAIASRLASDASFWSEK
ncbi:uncharacterized protein LOC123211190 [Mangifera indica]|uniref:uncharacterized protein LOC123211190 n=1 Tax=Mangifera indica TaxID=29780 RepID=UPI001CFB2160|nr:uncharacterized protein LOC123211190 [Mangifera indica]